MAEGVQASLRIEKRLVRRGKDDARGSNRRTHVAAFTMPMPIAPPPDLRPATTGVLPRGLSQEPRAP